MARLPSNAEPTPVSTGVGLRAEHYDDVLSRRPGVGWFEVHSENYFGAGGKPHHYLTQIRRDYPLSLHGVGLSLGAAEAPNKSHLNKLKGLIDRYQPFLVSEHLSWSSVNGRYLNDLLPLPYTEATLEHISGQIARVQDVLGRQILIENVSSYLEYETSTVPEWEYLTAVAERSGCGILLDVNNIYVNSRNHGFDPLTFLNAVPIAPVQEIHLAGFTVNRFDDGEILIDTHNQRVADDVWELYRRAIHRFRAVPTLIEWDTDVPPFDVLLDEARKADTIRSEKRVRVA